MSEPERLTEGEEELNRLLAHLGSADAGAGFEDRVRRRVSARMEARQEERRKVWRRWLWAPGAALAMASVVVGVWVHAERLVQVQMSVAQAPGVERMEVPHAAERPPAGEAPRLHIQHVAQATRTSRKSETLTETGFPAPSAPLTEQEKLLLRVARRPDPEEIAMLDARVREERDAADDAEFDEFFNPPPSPKRETTPTEAKPEKIQGESR